MRRQRTPDIIPRLSNRNERLRLMMMLIIAGTLPFYCFAIYFIGSAPLDLPAAIRATDTPSGPAPTFTPLGANLFLSPSPTSGPPALATHTPLSLPIRTPAQFVPPTAIPVQSVVAPTSAAPTLAGPAPVPTDVAPTGTGANVGPADADFDGIADGADDCPDDFGYADNRGCPYSDDEDRDGIRDALDACPNEFAPNTARGCRDFDDDGLDSAADDCPDDSRARGQSRLPADGRDRRLMTVMPV